MDSELFSQAIRSAQAALAYHDRLRFIVSVRVAQSASIQRPRLVQLLENSIEQYPAEMSARVLAVMARRC